MGTTRKSSGFVVVETQNDTDTAFGSITYFIRCGRGKKNLFNIKYMIRTSFHVLDDQQIKGQYHEIVARGPMSIDEHSRITHHP